MVLRWRRFYIYNSIIQLRSNDEYTVNYDCVDDDRMRAFNVGSHYCDLQGINGLWKHS